MITIKYILLFALVFGTGDVIAQSCATDISTHYNYADIKKILDKNQCNSCHYKSSHINGWHYETYEAMMVHSFCRTPIVTPGILSQSLLIDKINGGWVDCGNSMPLNGGTISYRDLFSIEQWIISGAPEFCIPKFPEIKYVLEKSGCGDCHNQEAKWNLSSYQNLINGLTENECIDEKVVFAGNASKSLLFTKLNVKTLICGAPMPLNRPALDYLSIAKIRDWINAGATEQSRPLPVVLEGFTLQEYEQTKVRLYWETSAEINTDYFEIQYSTDGILFYPIGRKSAKGGINKKANYTFDFEEQRTGYNYYRLKLADLDGDFTYSPIRVSFLKNTAEIYSIYPNPLSNGQQLVLEWLPLDDRQKVRVSVMDFTGKQCYENIIHTGINNIILPGLEPGIYYLTVKDYNDTYKVERLVITGY